MQSRILVFDSGLGGLTVFREISRALPGAEIVYAADDAGFPYGAWTADDLVWRVVAVFRRLIAETAPDVAVVACNTASTLVLPHLRAAFPDLPFVGTVPAIKPAAAMTRTGTIGLLGTEATIRQGYVDRLEHEFAQGKRLLRAAAPALVAAAEARLRGEPVDPQVYAAAADALRMQPGGEAIDTVVLACTHFPLVEPELAQAFGPGVRFVHGAEGIARRIAFLTQGQEFQRLRPDLALFTRDGEESARLADSLKTYGLLRIEIL